MERAEQFRFLPGRIHCGLELIACPIAQQSAGKTI
jgi:hypothetical protein